MPEIGNFYEPYRRKQRERVAAEEALALAKKQEQHKEELVRHGMLRKVVTYDRTEQLTRIHYEPINTN